MHVQHTQEARIAGLTERLRSTHSETFETLTVIKGYTNKLDGAIFFFFKNYI